MSFDTIPSNLRVPFAYTEFNSENARKGTLQQVYKRLILAQKTSAGSAAADTPVLVSAEKQADDLFGPGSIAALMAKTALRNDLFTALWVIPVADNGSGAAATGSLLVTGPATAAGTIKLYIGGQAVAVGVAASDAQNSIATAINAAINAATNLPVTSTVSTNTVTLTAKNKGTVGNLIDVRVNYYDEDALPAGVGVDVTAMASGATDPSVTNAIAAMGDTQYHSIANALPTSTVLNAMETELEDRFGGLRQIDGHQFVAKDDTLSNLVTFGTGRNSKQTSVLGVHKMPTPAFQLAAALMSAAARELQNDPALPLQTVALKDVLAPARADRFRLAERNQLLYNGISTVKFDEDGTVRIERVITTYETSPAGAPDTAYLDLEPKATLGYLRFDWNAYMATKYPRYKLASDGNKFAPGQKVMTPKLARAEAVARFKLWENKGLVENVDDFIAGLTAAIDDADPNALGLFMDPDLMNQLRVLKTQIKFIL